MMGASPHPAAHRRTDAEQRRFDFRAAMFQRRGLGERDVLALAEQLLQRDRQRDDRRVCIECAHMQRSGHCMAVKQGRMQVACPADQFTVMPQLLQRCTAFRWATP